MGLGRVKTLWQRTDRGFPHPKAYNILGERELAYHRWKEAAIVSEARIRHVTDLMARAQPCPYARIAARSGWVPRMFGTRVRL